MKRITLFVLLIFSITACKQQKNQAVYIEGEAFGTTYHIVYFSDSRKNIQPGVDSLISAINQSVSTYLPDSDISRINRGDSTVVVDSMFREVFELSKQINTITSGYFDPTIGVLRNAYGFGDEKPIDKIDQHVLDSLMNYVGFQKVSLNEDQTVYKENPHIYFDFNAIAKGMGVDYMGRFLEQQGISDYLIEVGGEILAKGKNLEKNHPWVVGIETPDSNLEDRSFQASVSLQNEGLASSGNYRKYRLDPETGKKYVHTLNPLTGSAEMTDVTSATVIAPDCGTADAYATAFMAMGFERSKELLKNLPDIEAYLTYIDPDGSQKIFITGGFEQKLLD